MQERRQRIRLVLTLYLVLWMLPCSGDRCSLVCLLCYCLWCPVGWLVYWLVWKEFHG